MRLIDADALKARLDFCTTKGMGGTIAFTFKHMVDEQPTITPEPHWIPVTERLPEASGHYLVTEIWMGERVIVTRYYNKRKEGESFWSGHPQQTVFAWCELPEPYKEVTE